MPICVLFLSAGVLLDGAFSLWVSFSTSQNKLANINSNAIHNSSSEKLLGITIDTNLKFDIHVNNLCKKASQKLNVLTGIVSLIDADKKRSAMKAFLSWHFNYRPPVWMFHDRDLSNKINRIYERSHRILYIDNKSTFEELPWKGMLTLSWQGPLSYRNQSIDLLRKSMDWFLYDNGLRHERVTA